MGAQYDDTACYFDIIYYFEYHARLAKISELQGTDRQNRDL